MTSGKYNITDIRKRFLDGSESPSGLLADIRKTIDEKNSDVHAYLEVYDDALEAATQAEQLLKEKGNDAPPLTGIPFAIKNNILIEGKKATAASKMLEGYVSSYDATVTTRLREAGAIFVGAANLDEFAMGSSTENSAFGPTKNPVDLSRVPGGSSGGSAAAVAMGGAIAALGTDTGGSVRLPASYCGVVGLKPTYGAVSRYGVIAMGSSLDQVGPLTHSVTDAETIFSVISGKDDFDATTYPAGTYPEVKTKETYRIGVPRDFLKEGIDADVMRVFEQSLEQLAKVGHEIVDVSLPYVKAGLAAYYIVMPAEVSSNLARYDGMRFGLYSEGENLLEDYTHSRRDGFGEEVKRRILLGTYVLSSGYYDAYYAKAEHVRELMRKELNETFADVDLLLTPTASTPAFKIGEKSDPLAMYLTDMFTVSANLTGAPALVVSGGTALRDGIELPVGIQYIAPHAGESRLFDIGKRFSGE